MVNAITPVVFYYNCLYNLFLVTIVLLQVVSNLMDAMSKSMEDMTNSTYLKFKQKTGTTRLPQTLFLFVNSIARTNLEVELVQREGSLCTPKSIECIPKRSCISEYPSIQLASFNCRKVIIVKLQCGF